MLDWNVILTALLYAALTGIFNLIFAHKSQINEWAEANPKLAAVLKVTRALGLDPQHLWAALALLVKGRLPKVQTEPLEPAPKSRKVPPGPLTLLCLCWGLLAGLGCDPRNPPCDESKLRAVDARYVARVTATCLSKYDRAEDCPEYPALKAQHRAELRQECPQ